MTTTPTFDEWRERIKETGMGHLSALRPQLEALRQAAVKAELLPGYPGWDTFMSYIQAAVEAATSQRDTLRDRMLDPTVVDHGRLMELKVAISERTGQIAAWNAVLELPQQIIQAGDRAKGLIEKMPEQAA